MSQFTISRDSNRLDREFIVHSLQTTYWAGDRSRETILASLDHSLCFAAYEEASGRQVGFARVVSDQATFSWLCDVFVDPAHRGHGLGKRLVAAVVEDPRLAKTRIYLGTKDAHELYKKFGFIPREMMLRPPPV